jgi:death-on-curing family protein
MKYVSKRMIVVINTMVLELSGGSRPVGNNIRAGQNLGFVDRIHANMLFGERLYPDIFHQAAAYMFYIIKDHIFVDGNKRTGLATAITFLDWNDVFFGRFDLQDAFDFVMSVAGGPNDASPVIQRLAGWLEHVGRA